MTELEIDQRTGVFLPKSTPPEIVSRLNAEINVALSDLTVREKFTDEAQEPVGGTADQYAKIVQTDFDKYARLVRELNIKVE